MFGFFLFLMDLVVDDNQLCKVRGEGFGQSEFYISFCIYLLLILLSTFV